MQPRGETILIVEDEPVLRRLLRRTLETDGYNVLEAANGQDAYDLARELREPLDLLVTDVVMPRMTGPELANAIFHSHPETKVLYISGYTQNFDLRRSIQDWEFLAKPFTPSGLRSKVADLLTSELAVAA